MYALLYITFEHLTFILYFLSNVNENIAFYLLIFIFKMTDFQFVCFPLKRVGAGPFSAHH